MAQYDRKQLYSIARVLSSVPIKPTSRIEPAAYAAYKAACKADFDGDIISMSSWRYEVFLASGVICHGCGLEAAYFAKERDKALPPDAPWHLNLYGIVMGKEVLFTKDHIIPVSKGGKDKIVNLQTMCSTCNQEKGCKEPLIETPKSLAELFCLQKGVK